MNFQHNSGTIVVKFDPSAQDELEGPYELPKMPKMRFSPIIGCWCSVSTCTLSVSSLDCDHILALIFKSGFLCPGIAIKKTVSARIELIRCFCASISSNRSISAIRPGKSTFHWMSKCEKSYYETVTNRFGLDTLTLSPRLHFFHI